MSEENKDGLVQEDPNNCSHNCSGCGSKCPNRIQKYTLNKNSTIKHTIGIVSGKGGVGKSLVTSLLASSFAKHNKAVAILDADITGPSMGKVFGINDKAVGNEQGIYPATTGSGIQLISTNMLLENDETPVVWRGPVITGLVQQFYSDVIWQDVDYMFIDMPPGTGDVPLTVFQSIPLDGIIIVTSPQDLVSMVVMKAINMAIQMNIPILGLVENMSYFDCEDCGHRNYPFGQGHGQQIAAGLNIPYFIQLPIDPSFAKLADMGNIEFAKNEDIDNLCLDLINNLEN